MDGQDVLDGHVTSAVNPVKYWVHGSVCSRSEVIACQKLKENRHKLLNLKTITTAPFKQVLCSA